MLTVSSTTAEMARFTSTHLMAPASSPVRHSWYTVVEMVAVLPGVYPAIMEVAPYSPRARAKASTVPAMMPCLQQGIRTRQKIQVLERPRVWAA